MDRLTKYLNEHIEDVIESCYDFDSDVIPPETKLKFIVDILGDGFEVKYYSDGKDPEVIFYIKEFLSKKFREFLKENNYDIIDNTILLDIDTSVLDLDYEYVAESIRNSIFKKFFMYNTFHNNVESLKLFILIEMVIKEIWDDTFEKILKKYNYTDYFFIISNVNLNSKYLVIQPDDSEFFREMGNTFRDMEKYG